MPYYKHGTLEDLHRAGLGEETFPKTFLQLLFGLHEFHKRGCAHRDLKEENILVGDDLTLIFGDPDFVKSENDDGLKRSVEPLCMLRPRSGISGARVTEYQWIYGRWASLSLVSSTLRPSDPFPGFSSVR